jgi:hypothetical protein
VLTDDFSLRAKELNMTSFDQSTYRDQRLNQWCVDTVASNSGSKCTTIGLTSGNRYPNDARVIYRLAKSLSEALLEGRQESNLLLCRLDVKSIAWGLFRSSENTDVEARIEKSALGSWDHVEIPIVVGNVAPKSLQQFPRLLPKWKLRYSTIIVDLGPIHQIPSRTIGRLCDANFVVIGPNSCASAQWISEQVDYHLDCGADISGTIVASAAA